MVGICEVCGLDLDTQVYLNVPFCARVCCLLSKVRPHPSGPSEIDLLIQEEEEEDCGATPSFQDVDPRIFECGAGDVLCIRCALHRGHVLLLIDQSATQSLQCFINLQCVFSCVGFPS